MKPEAGVPLLLCGKRFEIILYSGEVGNPSIFNSASTKREASLCFCEKS
jgi:hypothetical protein